MTKKDIKIMLQQRIDNLKKDLIDLSSGVEKIIIENLIKELDYLSWAIENPKDEIYTSTGFRFPYRP
jgi:hypothetical protein